MAEPTISSLPLSVNTHAFTFAVSTACLTEEAFKSRFRIGLPVIAFVESFDRMFFSPLSFLVRFSTRMMLHGSFMKSPNPAFIHGIYNMTALLLPLGPIGKFFNYNIFLGYSTAAVSYSILRKGVSLSDLATLVGTMLIGAGERMAMHYFANHSRVVIDAKYDSFCAFLELQEKYGIDLSISFPTPASVFWSVLNKKYDDEISKVFQPAERLELEATIDKYSVKSIRESIVPPRIPAPKESEASLLFDTVVSKFKTFTVVAMSAFAIYGLYKLLVFYFKNRSYRVIAPPPSFQPPLLPRTAPFAAPPSVDFFPPHRHSDVIERSREIELNDMRSADLSMSPETLCSVCKKWGGFCLCADNGASAALEKFALYQERAEVYNLELADWMNEYDSKPLFQVGQKITINFQANEISELFLSICIPTKITFQITSSFFVHETRPHSDRHVTVTNTRFYGLDVIELYLDPPFTRINLPLRLAHIRGRDQNCTFFISEEHLRLRRRGVYDRCDRVIQSQLENMVSIPIGDPVFMQNLINPLEDGFTLLRAFRDRKVLPEEDF